MRKYNEKAIHFKSRDTMTTCGRFISWNHETTDDLQKVTCKICKGALGFLIEKEIITDTPLKKHIKRRIAELKHQKELINASISDNIKLLEDMNGKV